MWGGRDYTELLFFFGYTELLAHAIPLTRNVTLKKNFLSFKKTKQIKQSRNFKVFFEFKKSIIYWVEIVECWSCGWKYLNRMWISMNEWQNQKTNERKNNYRINDHHQWSSSWTKMIFFFCFSGHRKLYHLLPFHHYIDCCLLCMSVLVLVFSFAAKTKQKKYNTLTIFSHNVILKFCLTVKQKNKNEKRKYFFSMWILESVQALFFRFRFRFSFVRLLLIHFIFFISQTDTVR